MIVLFMRVPMLQRPIIAVLYSVIPATSSALMLMVVKSGERVVGVPKERVEDYDNAARHLSFSPM